MPSSGWRLTRRNFLVIGGVATASGALLIWLREALFDSSSTAATSAEGGPSTEATSTASAPSAEPSPSSTVAASPAKWSDPAAWPDGAGVPAAGSAVTVERPILLDEDVDVASLTVAAAGSLTFDPESSHTLTSAGNVVVHGQLVMHPAEPSIIHALTFAGVNERAFVGDGMEPLDTDTGLWVMHDGTLDIQGAARLGWARAAGAIEAGATSIALADEPTGWRAGDELVITPTGPPRGEDSERDFDAVAIASVSGRVVRLQEALRRDHPSVTLGDSRVMTAEVLNLTRNVRIEGTAKGRAHVMVHSARPQSIRYASVRHMGPRQPDSEFTEGVIGRYPLHFHLCEDGSRGSVVEGAVVRDAGNHAFVPHTSHGVTFRDCVSYDTYDDAYWWDQAPDTRTAGPPTDDTVYERCVAALVKFDPPFRGYRLNGFALARGRGNIARGCVAVGVLGNGDASGFHWPEGSEGVWVFEDCITHNSLNGIFTWQNTDRVHTITDFIAYHNHSFGIAHGAYGNPYHYRDSILHGNRGGAVLVHAASNNAGLRFTNLICEAAGESDYLVETARHQADSDQPTRFAGCRFSGAGSAAFGLAYEGDDGEGEASLIEVVDCTFGGNEFWLADGIHPRSELRVSDSAHGSLVLRRNDQDGDLNPDWNARVTPL